MNRFNLKGSFSSSSSSSLDVSTLALPTTPISELCRLVSLSLCLRNASSTDILFVARSPSSDAPSFHLPEVEPATAAAHTLRAAQKLAEAMEGRPRSFGRRRSFDPVDPRPVGSFEPGTDALERLVAAAAARVAATTDELEKTAKAYAA